MRNTFETIPSLVGRTTELERCDRLIDNALSGRGTLLLVSGEAGIGKTALTAAIGQRAEARGTRFALGRCYETGGMPAFAPWQELFGDLRRAALAGFDQLPPPFGDRAASRTEYELRQSVTRALVEAAGQRPLLLCLDDVHWADPDTLELLWFLSREVGSARVLMVATFRSDAIDRHHPLSDMLLRLRHDCPTDMLRLAELTLGDTAQLVDSRSGPCSPELAAHLHARSDGNPFYIVELLRDLHEQRLLKLDAAGRWSTPAQTLPVPSIVEHIILQRIARFGRDGESLLRLASVVGQEWQLSVVEAVLGWDEARLLAALEAVLASHAIVCGAETPETYRFAHALIRDVLYAQLLVRRRRQLHAQVGGAMEALLVRDDDGAKHAGVAYQFAAAEDWPKALKYAISAGDWSRARYATRTALRFYELAREALEHLDQDSTGAEATGIAVQLHERIAKLHAVLNEQELAQVAFTRMREFARQRGDVLAESEALVWQSAIHARMNRFAEARLAADAVLKLAGTTTDRRLRARAHRSVGHLQASLGDLVEASEHLVSGAQLARDGPDVDALGSCLYDLAVVTTWRGDYLAAERLAEEALALVSVNRDAALCTRVCFSLGLARTEHGRYQAALQALHLGIDTAIEAGELRYVAKLMNTLGGLHDDLGDFDGARQWSQQALEAARGGHDVAVLEAERYALLGLASASLHIGNIGATHGYLDAVQPLLDVTPYARFRYLNRYQLLRAELALAMRDSAQVRRWAAEARDLAESKGVRKNVARSWLLSGRALTAIGAFEAAADELRQGVTLADALQHAALVWQGRLWLAQALEERRLREATEVYAEAGQRIDAIAAALSDQRLHDCFLNSPLVRQVRRAVAASGVRPKLSYPAGLTGREAEVLRLVASGATNAHIAHILSISPRTVDVHMTKILAKTGCPNRAAAVGFALRQGLA